MIYKQNSLSVVFLGASQWETERHTGSEHHELKCCAFVAQIEIFKTTISGGV